MEYKQLRDITPRAIFGVTYNVGGHCFMREFTRLVRDFELEYEEAAPFDRLVNVLGVEPVWAKWFIDHGFIEEVKEEKVYLAGQKFNAQGQVYKLRCHNWGDQDGDDCIAGMFSMTYELDWVGIMVRVKDRVSITEKNIKEMLGDIPFKPVKE